MLIPGSFAQIDPIYLILDHTYLVTKKRHFRGQVDPWFLLYTTRMIIRLKILDQRVLYLTLQRLALPKLRCFGLSTLHKSLLHLIERFSRTRAFISYDFAVVISPIDVEQDSSFAP